MGNEEDTSPLKNMSKNIVRAAIINTGSWIRPVHQDYCDFRGLFLEVFFPAFGGFGIRQPPRNLIILVFGMQ